MFLNNQRNIRVLNRKLLNRKHEMFLNQVLFGLMFLDFLLNRKHEMFLNLKFF